MLLNVITTYEEFLTLETDWNRLFALRSERSLFDTFEWNRIWLKHFQNEYIIRVLVFGHASNTHNSQPRVSNIFPLVKHERRFHFIGIHDRDRSMFLAEPSAHDFEDALSYLNNEFYTHLGLFNLSLADAQKAKYTLEKLGAHSFLQYKKESFVSTDTFDPSQAENAREMQRKLRKLHAQGALEHSPIVQPELPEWFLEKLCDWGRARYRAKGYIPRFCATSYRQWITELFASTRIPLFAYALKSNTIPIAIGFGYKNTPHEYLLHCHVFDETSRRLSPGALGVLSCIDSARAHGITFFNLGPGEMQYKTMITNDYFVRADLIIVKNFYISLLHRTKSFIAFLRKKLTTLQNNASPKLLSSMKKWLWMIPGMISGSHRSGRGEDITILCYHKVSDFDQSFLSVGVNRFTEQMKYLKHNYTIITLSQMKEYLRARRPLPPDAIAITFDDGYRNNYEFVFPIIQQLNIPISIFLCGAYIPQSPTTSSPIQFYPWDREKERCMNAHEIGKMLASGLVEFYPHTMTHPTLSQIPLEQAGGEIVASKQWIDDLIRTSAPNSSYQPDIFAYPRGNPGVDFTKEHENLVREAGFVMALSLRRASQQHNFNLMNVERRMIVDESLMFFKLRIAGCFDRKEPPARSECASIPENKTQTAFSEKIQQSLATHTLIQTIGKILSLAIAVITVPVITRYFGPERYGYLTTALSFLYFFGMMSEFGIYNLTSRELPTRTGDDQQRFFGNTLGLKTALSAATTLAAAAIIWVTPYPFTIKLIVVIASAAFGFQSFVSVLAALLQYRMRTSAIAIGDVFNKLGIGVFALLTWTFHLPLEFFILGYLAGITLNIAVVFIAAKKTFPVAFRADFSVWKQQLALARPFWILSIVTFVYFRADSLILGFYHPQSIVGIYGAAYKLLEVAISFPGSFTGLLLPMLSRQFGARNHHEFSLLFQKGVDSLSFFIFPMITFILCTAPFIINTLAGSAYSAATPILRILILATGVIFFAYLTTAGVAAVNAQKDMVPFSASAALGALMLYFLLIPRFSYFGAAWTTLLVELFILGVTYRLIRKKINLFISFKRLGLFALSAGFASVSFLAFPPIDMLSFLLGSVLFGVLYMTSSILFKAIDTTFLNKLIRNFSP